MRERFIKYVKEHYTVAKAYALAFLRWFALGASAGLACGVLGTAFAHAVSCVTDLRGDNPWLIYLLPVGGLLSVAIYKLCRAEGMNTYDVLSAVRTETYVSRLLAPAVFAGSVITHLLGGSAGKEGAALQIGGSISTFMTRALRLDERSRHIITMCCMGGLFSAVFGTPLGACVFAIEVVTVGQICSAALFPVLICSLTAYGISVSLGVHPERFHVGDIPSIHIANIWQVALIAIIVALISALFCHVMHLSGKLFTKYIKDPYLRILTGGVIIILLTLLVGNNDYNGGGIPVIERVFEEGKVVPFAFALKMLFTAITIGCGYKGGEIVPSFFIGATLGGTLALALGISPALGAAVGMAAMFCGVTNCPLATCFLCIEMFGGEGVLFYALATFISFVLSGCIGLYTGQKLLFSKLNEELLD
ncbi:MAG: chloride channel protein [Clostridia bacterium]|nr:chloride channel protein [Clostridia bacterium]